MTRNRGRGWLLACVVAPSLAWAGDTAKADQGVWGLWPQAGSGVQSRALVVAAAGEEAWPRVVVTLRPLHSLLAGVMEGLGAPVLVGGGSPHGHALRPSDARALAAADLVFWTGTGMETGLARGIARLAQGAIVVALKEVPGAVLRGKGAIDGHMWLDPANARALVEAAAAALAALDPARAEAYQHNRKRVAARLVALDARLRRRLGPVSEIPYVVAHDAYRYFERRYGLASLGAIAASPQRPPGARRLVEIRKRMVESGARCVFAEAGIEPAQVRALAAETGAQVGWLDPLGVGLEPGPAAYFTLMERLADALIACLAPPP